MRQDNDNTELDNLLNRSYSDIDIPDGLKPDNINIVSYEGEQYDDGDVPEFGKDYSANSDKPSKTHFRRIAEYVGGLTAVAAAVACVIFAGKGFTNNDRPYIQNEDNETAIEAPYEEGNDMAIESVCEEDNDITSNESKSNTASSYEEIYNLMKNAVELRNKDKEFSEEMAVAEDMVDGAVDTADDTSSGEVPAGEAVNGNSSSKQDYSDTNIQVDGVDEADIIKTDGEYIYYVDSVDDSYSNNCVRILKADSGKLEKVNNLEITCDNDELYISEMYLYNNKLVVIGTDNEYQTGSVDTIVWIYDVSNPYKAKEINKIKINGYYSDSRCRDGYLYMFTNYYPLYGVIDKEKTSSYIPCVDDEMLECSDIYISDKSSASSYIVITAINIPEGKKSDRCKITEKSAVLSGGGQLYVSTNSIYVLTTQYKTADDSFDEYTAITKFDYDKGKVDMKCTGRVKGFTDSQFSADEYKGYLRIVTTLRGDRRKDSNALYVLDGNLDVVGSIGNIAKGERVYSARFYGDYGYFVTYYQTDPLFTVDLSNPNEPEIVSEIKLPGFSDYLQGFGEDRLFGIGYDTIEVDTGAYVADVLKISMFNISDKENVTEENTLLLKDYNTSSACYGHKNLLINYEKNIIGFEARSWDEDGETVKYLVYEYVDNRFKQVGAIDYGKIMGVDEFNIYDLRGIYIGDYLYVISKCNGVASFELDGLKPVDKLGFH